MAFYKVTWYYYVEAEDEDSVEASDLDFDILDCDFEEVTEAEAIEKAPWLRA